MQYSRVDTGAAHEIEKQEENEAENEIVVNATMTTHFNTDVSLRNSDYLNDNDVLEHLKAEDEEEAQLLI